MTIAQQTAAAKKFAEDWKGRGNEDQDTQLFWIGFLQDVLGVSDALKQISFEKRVRYDGRTTRIDSYIQNTRVLIEQKSYGIDLDTPEPRHGEMLTPFKQAEQYYQKLPLPEKARYIIVCNFDTFRIHDMQKEDYEKTYEEIKLCDLPKEYHRFAFLIDQTKQVIQREMEISKDVGDIVGQLYDAIKKQYHDPCSDETAISLNKLCVRLVFCLYAEDSGIFDEPMMFRNYLNRFEARDIREALVKLFCVLDTEITDRDPYISSDLAAFPYVNGGLFSESEAEIRKQIPQFTDDCKKLLLEKACAFDWKEISPTIFGAIFESTLRDNDQRTNIQRENGMHYTSIENIHKVIAPLFLDALKAELDDILKKSQRNKRREALEAYRQKLASLCFLDPACGSGNFLTETYTCLRRLENTALRQIIDDTDAQVSGQKLLTAEKEISPIKVSVSQFYGIEIHDFAVAVARTALLIAESQMWNETKQLFDNVPDYLPLTSLPNIVEANALRIDWNDVVQKEKLSYIISNPPFVGGMLMTDEQKDDIKSVMSKVKGVGELDYVAAWYWKAAELMQGTDISAAFVSTNSICQGQQALTLWKPLFEKGISINYAYQTFIWDSEANLKAHVYCVIVGFSYHVSSSRLLYTKDGCDTVEYINSYLTSAKVPFISSRSTPLCDDAPPMRFGSMPRGKDLLLSPAERDAIIKETPAAAAWIRPFVGAEEFIHGKERYCLWLIDVEPEETRKSKLVKEHLANVKAYREREGSPESTKKLGKTPGLFAQIAQPDCDYLLVPCHSSENRLYIPMAFMSSEYICGNANQLIPGASLYHFGVLTSIVHMAWMRKICGRLESRYRYSKDIVYNNFPWCNPTDSQKAKIEQTAQAILDARANHPNSTLADLYDDEVMPSDLVKTHEENDKAVKRAYGFKIKASEEEIFAELMKMYQALTENNA